MSERRHSYQNNRKNHQSIAGKEKLLVLEREKKTLQRKLKYKG